MQFTLVDRITDLQPGERIQAVKALSLAEEYLKDHFPRFPVMPGVMMVESMYQAAAWLIYATEDFKHSTILLKEARNVRYADFVTPGQSLVVTAEIQKQDETTTTLKGVATVEGRTAVSGRLVLERFNLADRYPDCFVEGTDVYTVGKMRRRFELMFAGKVKVSTV